jgi:predicted Fe-Mo cluster-binding NifX family protein
MKILITAQDKTPQAQVDPRFGRAKYFMVLDTDTGQYTPVDNAQNLNAAQGAGIQAGRQAVELGAQVVLTGHVGPKAFATLQAGGVKVCSGASGTIAEAVEMFRAGKLQAAAGADVQGHWL